MAFCLQCDRSFSSQSALDQHLNSSIHASEFICEDCDRSFGSQSALDQHLNSSIHAPEFVCEDCDRSFSSQSALDQHLNSSIHAPKFHCEDFNDTPLDQFFLSYPSFEYDRSLPPAESFNSLRRNQRWRRGSLESDEAWDQYQKALKEEFKLWYGAEDDLGAWHALCRAIRIKPLPTTCEESEKVRSIRDVYKTSTSKDNAGVP
jgi:hypothetical protein